MRRVKSDCSVFSVTDNIHANTPLHWALLAKNSYAVQLLMDKAGVDFQVCTDVFVFRGEQFAFSAQYPSAPSRC